MANAEVFQFDVERRKRRPFTPDGIISYESSAEQMFTCVGTVLRINKVAPGSPPALFEKLMEKFSNIPAGVFVVQDNTHVFAWFCIRKDDSSKFFRQAVRQFMEVLRNTRILNRPVLKRIKASAA